MYRKRRNNIFRDYCTVNPLVEFHGLLNIDHTCTFSENIFDKVYMNYLFEKLKLVDQEVIGWV